jgi:hypothetical protein
MAKPPTKSNAIQTTAKGSVAHRGEDVPDWVKEGTAGFEGVTAQDLILPRLQLAQALSPAVRRNDPAYIKGLEEGSFFSNISRENFGPGPFTVTPLLCAKMRILWNDTKKIGSGIKCMGTPCPPSVKNREGIACRLNDGNACLHPDLDDDEPCFLIYNFPVILHARAELGPMVLSFRSTGVKVAKTWLSMMRMRGRFPMYAMAFNVEAVDASNTKGQFKQVKIDNAGWTPKELVGSLEKLYTSLADRVILTDQDDEPAGRQPGDEEM